MAVELGHTCVNLRKWHELPSGMKAASKPEPHPADEMDEPEEDTRLPSPLSPEEWVLVMEKYPGTIGEVTDPGSIPCVPLLFDREHLLVFLNKYYVAEKEIADFLKKRLGRRKLPVSMEKLSRQIHAVNTLFQSKKEGVGGADRTGRGRGQSEWIPGDSGAARVSSRSGVR